MNERECIPKMETLERVGLLSLFKSDIIKSAILIWRIITYFLNILVFAPFSRVGDASEVKETLENIR